MSLPSAEHDQDAGCFGLWVFFVLLVCAGCSSRMTESAAMTESVLLLVRISVKWNTHSGDVEHGFRRSGTLVGAQRRWAVGPSTTLHLRFAMVT